MFKFDLNEFVAKVESIVSDRGQRIPTDELVILLSKEGFLLAVDNEGDLDVEKSVLIFKSLISLTTNLNCSVGRGGGIGLTSWEKASANKQVNELTALRRDIENLGFERSEASQLLGKYMSDLLSAKTGVMTPKEIVGKYL